MGVPGPEFKPERIMKMAATAMLFFGATKF